MEERKSEIRRNLLSPIVILIILISLTGTGYFFLSMRLGTTAYWQYGDSVYEAGGMLEQLINYGKDIFILLWFIKMMFDDLSRGYIRKSFAIAVVVITLGACTLMASGYNMMCFVAGIRAYIYVFAIYNYCKEQQFDNDFWKTLSNVYMFLIILQLAAVIYQWSCLGFDKLLGSGGYRAMGLFTNGGTLGFFSVGAASVLAYSYTKYKNISKPKLIFAFALLLIEAFTSGTRAAFVYVMIWLVIALLSQSNLSGRDKFMVLPFALAVILPVVITQLVNAVDRGALMDSGSGRFEVWLKLLDYNALQLLVGQGFGVATNTSVSMGVFDVNMDSTYTTVIMQFGIVGFIVFISFLISKIYTIIKSNSSNMWFALYLSALIVLLLFTGNSLEIYSVSVPLTVVMCELLKGELFDENEEELPSIEVTVEL